MIVEPSPAPDWIDDLVAVVDELAHARRRERDAVLVGLDLRGDADPHDRSLRAASSSTGLSIPSISSKCSGPAMSGGDSWMTGSPRSSARQISPAS